MAGAQPDAPLRHPDRTAVIEYLVYLEPDQLECTGGVLITMYSDTRQSLHDTGRTCNPATVVREVDAVAKHEFAVTAATRLARKANWRAYLADSTEGL